jgi:hypothetical protein
MSPLTSCSRGLIRRINVPAIKRVSRHEAACRIDCECAADSSMVIAPNQRFSVVSLRRGRELSSAPSRMIQPICDFSENITPLPSCQEETPSVNVTGLYQLHLPEQPLLRRACQGPPDHE